MSEERRKEKYRIFELYVPDSKKESFELYKKVVKILGLSLSKRIMELVEEDETILFKVLEEVKEREENKA
jgi:hypothetical protein